MGIDVNMLGEQELAELLEIRRQMSVLQARYDAIVARSGAGASLSLSNAGNVPTTISSPAVSRPAVPERAVTAPVPPASSPAPVKAPASAMSSPVATKVPAPTPVPSVPAVGGVTAVVPPAGASPLSAALMGIISKAGKSLSFEEIYKRLEQDYPALVPADKPKLVVRKVLYDRSYFKVVVNGLFALMDGVDSSTATTVSRVPEAESPAPAVPDPVPAAELPQAGVESQGAADATPPLPEQAGAAAQNVGKPVFMKQKLDAMLRNM